MSKGFYKHKVLLDENMPQRAFFPRLNNRFNIKHVRDDFHRGSIGDPEVYDLAVLQGRILVTYNIKHFRSLAGSKNDAGIIGVSPNLTPAQVDTKLTALLTKSTPGTLLGKYTNLTGETEL
jgi:hypothetical protein